MFGVSVSVSLAVHNVDTRARLEENQAPAEDRQKKTGSLQKGRIWEVKGLAASGKQTLAL